MFGTAFRFQKKYADDLQEKSSSHKNSLHTDSHGHLLCLHTQTQERQNYDKKKIIRIRKRL
jgi:hypothetical protein